MQRLAPIDALSQTAKDIVISLRRHGECTVDELAARLSVTSSAIRQQLTPLAAKEIVAYREHGSGAGRRRRFFRLGAAAQDLFDTDYPELVVEMARLLEDQVPGSLTRLLEDGGRRRAAALPRLRAELRSADRAEEFLRLLEQCMLTCTLEPAQGGALLLCVFAGPHEGLATAFPEAVRAEELALLSAFCPTLKVEATHHDPGAARTYVLSWPLGGA